VLQIFERLAISEGLQLDPDAREALLERFGEKEGDNRYGNARGVRKDFEAGLVRHANRIAPMISPIGKPPGSAGVAVEV
jgi:AAA lid domain